MFTRKFFGMQIAKSSSFLTRLRNSLRCWLKDGQYDVLTLECLLKAIYGDETRLFDIDHNMSGTKVAVTATTISNASTYIFSNYNGAQERNKTCGKKKST